MRNFSVNFGLTQKYKTENFLCKAGQKKVVDKTKHFQGLEHAAKLNQIIQHQHLGRFKFLEYEEISRKYF